MMYMVTLPWGEVDWFDDYDEAFKYAEEVSKEGTLTADIDFIDVCKVDRLVEFTIKDGVICQEFFFKSLI